MSKKNILNEVKRFMKLANLDTNVSTTFVNKLEEMDQSYSRDDEEVMQEEEEELEVEDDVEDEVDMDIDMDVEAEEEAVISDDEADVLIALGQKLAAAQEMGAEGEVEDALDDLDAADDMEMDAEDLEGDAAEDLEDAAEDLMQEETIEEILDGILGEEDYTAKKERPGADKRKGAEKRGAEGTLAKTKGHGRVDYVNEETDAEKEAREAEEARKDRDKRKGTRSKQRDRRVKAGRAARMEEELHQEVLRRVKQRLRTLSKK
jgi:hypothetical protein